MDSGNQWARMTVPSKEVTFQSVDTPGTGVARTGPVAGAWQAVVEAVRAAAVVADDDAEDEQPARTTAVTTRARAAPRSGQRWRGAAVGRRGCIR